MRFTSVVALVVLSVSGRLARAADLYNDFSVTNGNPNGAWRYGSAPAGLPSGYTLTLFTDNAAAIPGTLSWHGSGSFSTPLVTINPTSSTIDAISAHLLPHTATLHPSSAGPTAIARYVVPASGAYAIDATFAGADTQPTSTDVHVLVNGTALYNGSVNSYQVPQSYSGTMNLLAGDRVDFAVGWGSNSNYTFDTTTVWASVNAVPEPGTLMVLGLAGVGLMCRRPSRRGRKGEV